MLKAKFDLGQTVVTSNVLNTVRDHSKLIECLHRHSIGDWGDVPEEDREMNELGLDEDNPDRLMSVYHVEEVELWCITEWDRSVTTILLPEDY